MLLGALHFCNAPSLEYCRNLLTNQIPFVSCLLQFDAGFNAHALKLLNEAVPFRHGRFAGNKLAMVYLFAGSICLFSCKRIDNPQPDSDNNEKAIYYKRKESP